MSNFIDLRKKPAPEIVVIEKKRSFLLETVRLITIIAISSCVIWVVSKADTLQNSQQTVIKNWSVLGVVSELSPSIISIIDAHSSDKTGNTSYELNLSTVKRIENSTYVPLQISDINIGDKIVAQGVVKDNIISIRRIISFSTTAPKTAETSSLINETVSESMNNVPITTATTTETTTDIPIKITEEISTTTEEIITQDIPIIIPEEPIPTVKEISLVEPPPVSP
jgi:hypothetical protein